MITQDPQLSVPKMFGDTGRRRRGLQCPQFGDSAGDPGAVARPQLAAAEDASDPSEV